MTKKSKKTKRARRGRNLSPQLPPAGPNTFTPPLPPKKKIVVPSITMNSTTTEIVDTPHIVDPEEVNDFEISVGTLVGKNKRNCPCCKKMFKVEALGPHVKKSHPPFWSALFTVESLQSSIENKQLVSCTVADGDHDQKFLICLACDSIRTTDRAHFKKNGKIHEDAHYEKCTQMIATRNGVQYIPKAKTDMEKLLTQLDKYKRIAKICEHEHSDVGAAIADKEDAEMKVAQLLKENNELRSSLEERVENLNKNRKNAIGCIKYLKQMNNDFPYYGKASVASNLHAAVGLITQFLASM